ncbi:MAG: PadR family transcriptional regulator [Anaerolineales bacterium]|nr:PadR family transcriptional regulator [Chloroflexota bacterium]MBL6980747.1 PadR family transcriptional regulator [Anaerolineales bacterium]
MTNAELAILSLIAEKSRHGYEIEQVIEARGMRDWTEVGFSSIYYLLNKLEKAGLIESRLEQAEGRGPARKVYQITENGQEAQINATLAALSEPVNSYPPFLLAMSNLPMLPPAQILPALNIYRNTLTERKLELVAKVEQQSPMPGFVEAMFDYSINLIEAEMAWIERFITQVEAGNV